MAERRMFAKRIIDSDIFLEMPLSTQALYFHLSMRADDDGFVNNPKRIIRMIGCNEDDMKILLNKQFLIPFESGIVVIKHWKVHNYIQKDRYRPSEYDERSQLKLSDSGVYILDTECIQDGYIGKDRLGKDRLGKDRLGKDRLFSSGFQKPTVEEIEKYCEEKNIKIDAEYFFDYYEAKGWILGGSPVHSWKALINTWVKNNQNHQQTTYDREEQSYDINEFEKYAINYTYTSNKEQQTQANPEAQPNPVLAVEEKQLNAADEKKADDESYSTGETVQEFLKKVGWKKEE